MKFILTSYRLVICLTFSVLFFISCNRTAEVKLAPNVHKVVAQEILQGKSYTYVRVLSGGSDYWVAINKTDIKEGSTYYWSVGDEMKEFTSREMKRTFRSIFFVEDFTDQPILATKEQKPPMVSMAGRQVPQEEQGIAVPKATGGMTIAELYSRKSSMAGKRVIVSGKVVRFAGGIMNRNWVHIQDGTRDAGNYDLALSTKDTVKVGDVVVFEGPVSVDKNIGAGYIYAILIEDARLKR